MHKRFDLPIRMVNHAEVPNASSEADLNEVGTEGFSPTLGGIPRAVQALSELAGLAAAKLGICRRKFEEDVPFDLCVQLRIPDIVDHHLLAAAILRFRGRCSIADDHLKGLERRRDRVECIISANIEFSSNEPRPAVDIGTVTFVHISPMSTYPLASGALDL